MMLMYDEPGNAPFYSCLWTYEPLAQPPVHFLFCFGWSDSVADMGVA